MNEHEHVMHGHDMETTTATPELTESVPYHVMGHKHNMTNYHNMTHSHNMTNHHMADHNMTNHHMQDPHMTDHHMHVNHDNSMSDGNGHLRHHDNNGAHHHHHEHHMHPMTFHSRNDDYILFSDWQLSPGKVTFFVCLALVLAAILYQAIKMVRSRLGRKCPNTHCRRYILSKGHVLQTVFYVAQFTVGYMLMLAVMTYNAWIMAAAVVGIGLGYFFFGWAEYEEIVKLRPIAMKMSGRSRPIGCGVSGEQELLPLSKDTTATDVSLLTSNIACHCEDDDL